MELSIWRLSSYSIVSEQSSVLSQCMIECSILVSKDSYTLDRMRPIIWRQGLLCDLFPQHWEIKDKCCSTVNKDKKVSFRVCSIFSIYAVPAESDGTCSVDVINNRKGFFVITDNLNRNSRNVSKESHFTGREEKPPISCRKMFRLKIPESFLLPRNIWCWQRFKGLLLGKRRINISRPWNKRHLLLARLSNQWLLMGLQNLVSFLFLSHFPDFIRTERFQNWRRKDVS